MDAASRAYEESRICELASKGVPADVARMLAQEPCLPLHLGEQGANA